MLTTSPAAMARCATTPSTGCATESVPMRPAGADSMAQRAFGRQSWESMDTEPNSALAWNERRPGYTTWRAAETKFDIEHVH